MEPSTVDGKRGRGARGTRGERRERSWPGRALRGAELLLALGLVASTAWTIFLVWRHLNLFQVDLAGHAASGTLIGKGYFHRFFDGVFSGYVPNLFYPPLEDLLLTALGALTGGDAVLAYRIYLTGLALALLVALLAAAWALRSSASRILLLGTLLALWNLDKVEMIHLPGLGWLDVLWFGLSAQTLSFIFCLWAVRWILGGRLAEPVSPTNRALGHAEILGLGAVLAGAVLSHLVVGPVTFALVGLASLLGRRREGLLAIAWGAAWTAFFWLPFLAHRGQLGTATVLRELPTLLLLVAAGTFLVALACPGSRRLRALPFAGIAVLLLLPEAIQRSGLGEAGAASALDAPASTWLPPFHYYRLSVLAVVAVTLALAVLLEGEQGQAGGAVGSTGTEMRRRLVRWGTGALVAGFLVFALGDFRFHDWDLDNLRHRDPGVPAMATADAPFPPLGSDGAEAGRDGRTLVLHRQRPIDFYLGSMALARGSEERFVKGLYWESSRSNQLLASHLVSAVDASQSVLDFWRVVPDGCDGLACLLDHFARDYAIDGLVVDRDLLAEPGERSPLPEQSYRVREVDYLDRALRSSTGAAVPRRQCWSRILREGTPGLAVERLEDLAVGGATYGRYRLTPRPGTGLANDLAVLLAPEELVALPDAPPRSGDRWPVAPVFEGYSRACASGAEGVSLDRRRYLWPEEGERWKALAAEAPGGLIAGAAPGGLEAGAAGGAGSPVPVSLERTAPGRYRLRMPGSQGQGEGAAGRSILWIGFSWFPGFELRTVEAAGEGDLEGAGEGRELELLDGVAGMAAVLPAELAARGGELVLVHRRTPWMLTGYGLSATAFLLGLLVLARRVRRRRAPATGAG